MYKKMWEYLKEYVIENDIEIITIMEQIEDMYFKKEDVIDELMKEASE